MDEITPQSTNSVKEFRAGFVAIIGEPNVGKSTLMNSLIGQKISIVTPKPQTTRHKVLGIFTNEESQVIFLDTPGLLKPKYRLQEAMMNSARAAMNDADLVLVMIDAVRAKNSSAKEHELEFQLLQSITKSAYLLINKIDAVEKQDLLPVIAEFSAHYPFKEVFPISALNNQGTSELLATIAKELPVHPPFYPSDSISEQSERFFVSEIIREKIFEKYREEIPYSTTVDIVQFKEEKGSKDEIHAEIYVERDSQKGILIGKKGLALKEIGQLARKDIEQLLGRPVFLKLFVKVRKNWREDDNWLKRLGYSE
ncbi:MAG: GTPase Era [Ignavibacteriae bacterium]|nr:GTPase Era [Ignavibacteriota bacterium]